MSIRTRRSATQQLTRMALVLAPPRARRVWFTGVALVLCAAAAGAGAARVYWPPPQVTSAPAGPNADIELRKGLENSHLTLEVAQARSLELERQIDALNHRLRETQEELAFFRMPRDAGRHRGPKSSAAPGHGKSSPPAESVKETGSGSS